MPRRSTPINRFWAFVAVDAKLLIVFMINYASAVTSDSTSFHTLMWVCLHVMWRRQLVRKNKIRFKDRTVEIKWAVKKTCLLFIPSNFRTFFKVTRRDTQINSPERTMCRANRRSILFVSIFSRARFRVHNDISLFHVWNFEFHFAKKN